MLFADVKSSTELAEQGDPEDWHNDRDGTLSHERDGHRVGAQPDSATRRWLATRPVSLLRYTDMGRAENATVGAFVLSVMLLASRAEAASAWVLWKHSYEVWMDSNKDNHRRDVHWDKIAAMATKSDCADRAVSEARAEYDSMTRKGIRVTLADSEVGFDQRNTRFTHGYHRFECWPNTVDPSGPKRK